MCVDCASDAEHAREQAAANAMHGRRVGYRNRRRPAGHCVPPLLQHRCPITLQACQRPSSVCAALQMEEVASAAVEQVALAPDGEHLPQIAAIRKVGRGVTPTQKTGRGPGLEVQTCPPPRPSPRRPARGVPVGRARRGGRRGGRGAGRAGGAHRPLAPPDVGTRHPRRPAAEVRSCRG